MTPPPAGSTEARPVVVEDDEQTYQERILALEKREQRTAEAEQLARDSGCRILMDGKMCPVFTLTANASCETLEGPAALASKVELERVLLRICSISQVARVVASQMLPAATTSSTSTLAAGSKRKAPDVETIYRCSRCKARFDTDVNLPKDCSYHPGELIARLPHATCSDLTSSESHTTQVAKMSITTLRGPTMTWTSGPTMTMTAMESRKLFTTSQIMREASYGHAASSEAMQMDVKHVSMMSGSNERVLEGRDVSMYGSRQI